MFLKTQKCHWQVNNPGTEKGQLGIVCTEIVKSFLRLLFKTIISASLLPAFICTWLNISAVVTAYVTIQVKYPLSSEQLISFSIKSSEISESAQLSLWLGSWLSVLSLIS